VSGRRARLLEVARLFTRLGFTAFGGPAAHTAMMHDEVVMRRAWVSEREFLDLLAAVNLIPGPNSTELAIHLGRRRAGGAGLVVAGACFIVPAMLIVLTLAWAYVGYGSTPEGRALLYGIGPVIVTIVMQALWKLGRTAVRGPLLAAVGAAALALAFLGVNELALLFGAGAFVAVALNARTIGRGAAWALVPWGLPTSLLAVAPAAEPALLRLFLTFLKIGAVLYGSGYVLLAFLRADFVERLGWLTERQLVDAVAVGQLTPGPLFTTATFVGYVVLGLPGALLATVAIFLPSFVFVAVTAPLIARMRASRWLGGLLDGVAVAALALMAAVTWRIALEAIVDVPTAAIALFAGAALIVWRPNSIWLVLAGGAAGFVIEALR